MLRKGICEGDCRRIWHGIRACLKQAEHQSSSGTRNMDVYPSSRPSGTFTASMLRVLFYRNISIRCNRIASPYKKEVKNERSYRRWRDYNEYERFPQQDRRYAGLTQGQMRIGVILTAAGVYVYVSSQQEIPYSGRRHAILLNVSSEKTMGQQTFAQIIREAKFRKTLLPEHHPASKAVRRVGQRIASIASDGYGGGFHEHMKHLKWEFAVINSPEVNAFVVPGGKVVVYTGLLKLIDKEDELGAVLAHEVAHVLARHSAERITESGIIDLFRMIAYWVFGLPIPQGPLAAVFFLPNSRKVETEADVIGIQLAARACYDPEAAVQVFSKLGKMEAKSGGAAVPKFLRTHPVSEDRIARIVEMLPKAKNLAEISGCSTSTSFLSSMSRFH